MGIFLNIVPCATYALAEYHVKAPSRSIDARIGGKGPREILESTCGVTHLRLLIRLSGVPKEKKSARWELVTLRCQTELWRCPEITVYIDLQGSIGFTTLIEDCRIQGKF